MIKIKTIFLITTLILISPSLTQLYKLIKHSKQRGAACLDGSPAGLYIHEGTGKNKTKYLIYFNGGGFCGGRNLAQTLQSCYTRSSTNLGTTNIYNETYSFNGHGVLSTLQKQNPHFYDWTKIFAIYCDGASHQGYRQAPIEYKSKQLYFRGTRNVLQHFHYLNQKYDFYNGDMIVITGVSAGGMSVYQWSNYLYQHTKKAKIYAIPDSGIFITDYYSPIAKQKVLSLRIQSLFRLVSSQSSLQLPQPVRKCLQSQQFYNDYISCFNAGNYAKYQKVPMLIVQSPYDQWCLNNILIVKCLSNTRAPYSLAKCNSTTMTAIDQYRKQSINTLKKMKGQRKDIGTWGPSCVQHGYISYPSLISESFKIPTGNGYTLNDVIGMFLNNSDQVPWMIEENMWPENRGCSGVAGGNLKKRDGILAYD